MFGARGWLNGDDIVTLCCASPVPAIHRRQTVAGVCVAVELSPAAVKRLAALWRDSNYEIKPLMRAMLLSTTSGRQPIAPRW